MSSNEKVERTRVTQPIFQSKIPVFESLIQHCNEPSYLYILNGQKLFKNTPKWNILASFFLKPEACGQTVLPDSIVKKWDFFNDFQILCATPKNIKISIPTIKQSKGFSSKDFPNSGLYRL